MKEIEGNLWDFHPSCGIKEDNYICIPTNGIVKNGDLIMGAGLAKQAKEKFSVLPFTLGRIVEQKGNHVHMTHLNIVSFPTKEEYWKPSTLEIIEQSCIELKELMNFLTFKPYTFYTCRPGTGFGGLKWEKVRPIMLKYFADEDRLIVVHKDGYVSN